MLWLAFTLLTVALVVAAALTAVSYRIPDPRTPFELGEPIVERPCETYVLWGWPRLGRRPVYVGEGYSAADRIARHRSAEWWPLVDTTREPDVLRHPSKYAAKRYEEYLIDTLDPIKNVRRRNKGIHDAAI